MSLFIWCGLVLFLEVQNEHIWSPESRPYLISTFKNSLCGKPSYPVGRNVNLQSHYRELWRFHRKLNIELPYDAVIPLLGIYPNKTSIQKDTCTPMFIATLFPTTKTWKQLECPSTDEQIEKMWYIYTMEYYSAIKKIDMMPFAATWVPLEILILNEVSQKEKDKYHMISFTCGIENMAQMNLSTEQKQIHRHGEQSCGCQG